MNTQNQPTADNLKAAEVLEMLEAAKTAKDIPAAILKAADVAAQYLPMRPNAEALRFAARRIQADPFSPTGHRALVNQRDQFREWAEVSSVRENTPDDPRTVPGVMPPKRSELTFGGRSYEEANARLNPGPGEVTRPSL